MYYENMTSDTNKRVEQIAVIAAIALLVVGCFIVVRPFISSILWASILTYSTWPVYERFRRATGGRDNVSALIMTIFVALLLLIPFLIVGYNMADNVVNIIEVVKGLFADGVFTQPPDWLLSLPLVGDKIQEYWTAFELDPQGTIDGMHSFFGYLRKMLLSVGGNIGSGILQMALSIFVSFFLYRDGVRVASSIQEILHKITGERTQELMHVVGNTVYAVVYGIFGTAAAQGIVAGIGFLIAGVPGPFLLAFLTFLLAFIPAGAPLIWIPATIWLFYKGSIGWGVFMAIWGFFGISGVDNVIRPYIISKGTKLPFVLVFLGVLGGLMSFGFLGLFLGPVLLTVGYTLLAAWNKKPEKI